MQFLGKWLLDPYPRSSQSLLNRHAAVIEVAVVPASRNPETPGRWRRKMDAGHADIGLPDGDPNPR
jgi:hypothetical protein